MKRIKRLSPARAKVFANSMMDTIIAADDNIEDVADDSEMYDDFDDPQDDFSDTLDDVADDVEDIQDAVDEVQEDDVNIDVDNNIAGHYIAECDGCKGIFISATIESDQEITKVTGICPLCDKETDQNLRWVIKDAKQRESQ